MAYAALPNTVSIQMNDKGKFKIGGQRGYNYHNNDPEKRSEHNPNVDTELTKYNFNLIYNNGELDTRDDIPDTQKFDEAFTARMEHRKKKDSLGRKVKLTGKIVARETIWYPPLNIFDGCTAIQEEAEALKKWSDDMMPFWVDMFGAENIIEISGHLDERKHNKGRPHIQMLSTTMLTKEQEFETTKKRYKTGEDGEKVVTTEVSRHTEGDFFQNKWFGGASAMKRIKERFRKHCISCGYDVKYEDMTPEERALTGSLFSCESADDFKKYQDELQDVADRETAVTARETAADSTDIELKTRKSDLDEQETAIQADRDDLAQREAKYQADLQTLVTGQQALQKKQEQAEKDFQAREDKQEAQKRALDEQQKQLDERREQLYTPPVANEKIPPFKAKEVVRQKNEQIAVLQQRSDRRDILDGDLQAARQARSDAERLRDAAAAERQTAEQERQALQAEKEKYTRLIAQQEQKIQQEVEKRVPDAAAKKYNFDAAVMRDFIARDPKRQEVYNRYHAYRVEQRQNSVQQMARDISQQMQDDKQYD